MNDLLKAFDIAIMKKLLLEVRYWLPVRVELAGLGGGTLWRCQGDVAFCGHLHLAIRSWRQLCKIRVRIGRGAKAASEESAHSQIFVAEAERIRRKPKEIRRGLVVESIPGIERQAEIGIAETGEQRLRIGGGGPGGLGRPPLCG